MDVIVNIMAVFLLILLGTVKILWHKVSELKKANQEANRINAQAGEVLRDVLKDANEAFLQQARDKVKSMIADACLKDRDVIPMRTVAQYLETILRSNQKTQEVRGMYREGKAGVIHDDDF